MGGYYAVYEVARCYALAGDTERGVEALQRAFRLGFPDVRQAIRDPDLAALRRDSRVIEMLGLQDVSAMSRDDGWRYDLTIFAREAHRKGFNTHLSVNRPVTREQFDAKVRDIRDAVPRLSDGQLVLEFIKLARFLEDGHSEVLWDFGDHPLLQPTLPLAFFWFDDGLFVTATDPEHRHLLGARPPGRRPSRARRAQRHLTLRQRGQRQPDDRQSQGAVRPAQDSRLAAAGLVRSPDRVTLAIRDLSGDTRDVVVHADSTEPDIWNKLPAPSGWETFTSTLTPPPLYVQHTDKPQWFEYLPDQKTGVLPVQQVSDGADESLLRFTTRLSAFIDANDVDRLVIDMRWNNGGSTSAAHPLLLNLISNKKVNQRGRLFVIIGRRTLSAAQNMATYFERYTNAIFVGEPTGSSPNFIGEEVPLTLPHSKLIANVSHLFWQSSWPQDQRVWLPPEIYVPPASQTCVRDGMRRSTPFSQRPVDSGTAQAMTDETLMLAVKAGNLDQLSGLFERYHRPLFGFFYRLLRDRTAAEDLVQDVFVRVLKYRHTFRERTSFKAWIFHIARNSRRDYARRHPGTDRPGDDEDTPADEPGPDIGFENREEVALLQQALRRLPADKRELIILARYREMNYQQLAAVMEIDERTIRVRLHRAIRQLGDIFHELRGTTRHAL